MDEASQATALTLDDKPSEPAGASVLVQTPPSIPEAEAPKTGVVSLIHDMPLRHLDESIDSVHEASQAAALTLDDKPSEPAGASVLVQTPPSIPEAEAPKTGGVSFIHDMPLRHLDEFIDS